MCEQHSSVPSQVISSDIMKATVNEIKECEQEKLTTLYKMMSSLKPIKVIKKKGTDNVCRKTLEENDK